MSDSEKTPKVRFGTNVYNEDGELLGHVRGFDDHGFFVTADDGLEGMSIQHIRSGHEFGEAELMWRCLNCGEMGEIDKDLPDECPNCGGGREDLYYWKED